MACCEPKSASVTRSKRPFSWTWKRERHSSRTAAPRRAASAAASRQWSSSVVSIVRISIRSFMVSRETINERKGFVSINPPAPFFQDQRFQRIDPSWVIVQATASVQFFAAGAPENSARLMADLVERLQAVGREAGQSDKNTLDPGGGELFQHVVGI